MAGRQIIRREITNRLNCLETDELARPRQAPDNIAFMLGASSGLAMLSDMGDRPKHPIAPFSFGCSKLGATAHEDTKCHGLGLGDGPKAAPLRPGQVFLG